MHKEESVELRHRLNPRIIFVSLYFICFAIYLFYGLQPAEAVHYNVTDSLYIPSINLNTDVTAVELEGSKLPTPDTIAGSFSMSPNKTLLIGHSTTVFADLKNIELGDEITFSGKTYKVIRLEFKQKSAVDMSKVLKSEELDTIIIMTCAGQLLDGGDATHRFMVTAEAI